MYVNGLSGFCDEILVAMENNTSVLFSCFTSYVISVIKTATFFTKEINGAILTFNLIKNDGVVHSTNTKLQLVKKEEK